MEKIFQKIKKTNGFTIIEVLVALALFSIALLTMFLVLSSGITNLDFAKRKITATFLAQEGIEYMRNTRDNFMFFSSIDSSKTWADFITKLDAANCTAGVGCGFNDVNGDFFVCTKDTHSCELGVFGGKYGYIFTNTNYFNNDSGFSRVITVEDLGEDEMKVTSTVYWQQNSGPQSVSFSEHLFNWY